MFDKVSDNEFHDEFTTFSKFYCHRTTSITTEHQTDAVCLELLNAARGQGFFALSASAISVRFCPFHCIIDMARAIPVHVIPYLHTSVMAEPGVVQRFNSDLVRERLRATRREPA
jgi:hypothetical protein